MTSYHVFNSDKACPYYRVIDAQSSFGARQVLAGACRATKPETSVFDFYAVRSDLLRPCDRQVMELADAAEKDAQGNADRAGRRAYVARLATLSESALVGEWIRTGESRMECESPDGRHEHTHAMALVAIVGEYLFPNTFRARLDDACKGEA